MRDPRRGGTNQWTGAPPPALAPAQAVSRPCAWGSAALSVAARLRQVKCREKSVQESPFYRRIVKTSGGEIKKSSAVSFLVNIAAGCGTRAATMSHQVRTKPLSSFLPT